MRPFPEEVGPTPILDWNETYLLGWYGANGRAYLTTWSGEGPPVECVVKGAPSYGPPMWSFPVPLGCVAYELPGGLMTLDEKISYATRHGGVYAFGWRVTGLTRAAV